MKPPEFPEFPEFPAPADWADDTAANLMIIFETRPDLIKSFIAETLRKAREMGREELRAELRAASGADGCAKH